MRTMRVLVTFGSGQPLMLWSTRESPPSPASPDWSSPGMDRVSVLDKGVRGVRAVRGARTVKNRKLTKV